VRERLPRPKYNTKVPQNIRRHMRVQPSRNQRWLASVVIRLADNVRREIPKSRLAVSGQIALTRTNTDGWYCSIGRVTAARLALEVWFDRYHGGKNRHLYVGLRSKDARRLRQLSDSLKARNAPVRYITSSDVSRKGAVRLTSPLMKNEFGELLLEKHSNGDGFLGLYIRHSPNGQGGDDQLNASTIALLQDVYGATAGEVDDSQLTPYPQYENRRIVATHLRRERSKMLSLYAKLRDMYRCRVCDMTFREHYGSLGDSIAEAHHLVPLSQLKSRVKTSVEDLISVCANCHTMLHRMGGNRHDYLHLRVIVKKRRRGSRR
jgi:hypothetical protein